MIEEIPTGLLLCIVKPLLYLIRPFRVVHFSYEPMDVDKSRGAGKIPSSFGSSTRLIMAKNKISATFLV